MSQRRRRREGHREAVGRPTRPRRGDRGLKGSQQLTLRHPARQRCDGVNEHDRRGAEAPRRCVVLNLQLWELFRIQ